MSLDLDISSSEGMQIPYRGDGSGQHAYILYFYLYTCIAFLPSDRTTGVSVSKSSSTLSCQASNRHERNETW